MSSMYIVQDKELKKYNEIKITCIIIKASASPAGAREPIYDGNAVAKTTTNAVMQVMPPP